METQGEDGDKNYMHAADKFKTKKLELKEKLADKKTEMKGRMEERRQRVEDRNEERNSRIFWKIFNRLYLHLKTYGDILKEPVQSMSNNFSCFYANYFCPF